MLAKTIQKKGQNWDELLPYILLAYRSSLQESTRESPFFLLYAYGCDPKLPAEVVFTPTQTQYQVNLDDYKSGKASGLWRAKEGLECFMVGVHMTAVSTQVESFSAHTTPISIVPFVLLESSTSISDRPHCTILLLLTNTASKPIPETSVSRQKSPEMPAVVLRLGVTSAPRMLVGMTHSTETGHLCG